jgi:hypothetical protein
MLDDVVGWVGGSVLEFLLELVLEFFKLFSWRVWFTLGFVGLGTIAIVRAISDKGPGHPALLFIVGASMLFSPLALLLFPASPPRYGRRPNRRR